MDDSIIEYNGLLGKENEVPKLIYDKKYYSIPEVATLIGVSRGTLFNWITNRGRAGHAWIGELSLDIFQDPIRRHYYLSEASVEKLRTHHADRFIKV